MWLGDLTVATVRSAFVAAHIMRGVEVTAGTVLRIERGLSMPQTVADQPFELPVPPILVTDADIEAAWALMRTPGALWPDDVIRLAFERMAAPEMVGEARTLTRWLPSVADRVEARITEQTADDPPQRPLVLAGAEYPNGTEDGAVPLLLRVCGKIGSNRSAIYWLRWSEMCVGVVDPNLLATVSEWPTSAGPVRFDA